MTEQGNRSYRARPKLEQATLCGCYYCLELYAPSEIQEWCDGQQTAICEKCGIDAVVPFDAAQDECPVVFKEKLKKWNKESFSI